jgi:hypothetical protein
MHIHVLLLSALVFFIPVSHTKGFSGINYAAMVPAYITHIHRSMMSTGHRMNEKVLARYVLALHVAEVSECQHKLNTKGALEEFFAKMQAREHNFFSATSHCVLKCSLQYTIDNATLNAVDRDAYQQVLDSYEDVGPVPLEAIAAIEQRIIEFAGS